MMKLLSTYSILLAVLIGTAYCERCNVDYVDCFIMTGERLARSYDGRHYRGYCECVHGIPQYTLCGDGKIFSRQSASCVNRP
uniref:Putative 7.8-9.7 kDa secreted peptide n=1 Tax=Psorophora albipes TaxID=869069 RepID=T1E3G0_9DIPT